MRLLKGVAISDFGLRLNKRASYCSMIMLLLTLLKVQNSVVQFAHAYVATVSYITVFNRVTAWEKKLSLCGLLLVNSAL